jgi:hypothetical protein
VRLAKAATIALSAIAILLSGSILAAALHDVSSAWDVWYYHLPFAARLAGIVREDAYSLHPLNHARFSGFPLLAELLQGLSFRVLGFAQAANLVAFGALAGYALHLRLFFRVPLWLAAIALLAIPLVQLHASSCYVDLPANVCVSVLILEVIRLWASVDDGAASGPKPRAAFGGAEPPARFGFVRLLVLAAIAANMRFQLHPVVACALVAAAPRVLPGLWRGRDYRALAVIVFFVPLIGATFLKNAIVHGNPYYPMRLAFAGITLPGVENAYSASPPYLEHAPRAQRFLYSILEIGIRPFDDRRRWTIDQWMPEDSTGCRMGGFFGAYVVFHLALLAWRAWRDRSRKMRAAAIGFALLTLLSAHVPQSHELRYYMHWMIVLVSLNLWLASDREDAAKWTPALGAACLAFLAVVLAVTRAGYAYPSGSTFAELVKDKVDARVLEQIHDGDRVCIAKQPWTFLYAAPFHPGRRYTVREAVTREDCGDFRWIE